MLRVASIPSTHPYVRQVLPAQGPAGYPHLAAPQEGPVGASDPEGASAQVQRLPDPLPEGRRPDEGVWWPARWLEPGFVAEHGGEADLVHLHFGFEGRTPEQLRAWVDALGARRLPLVLTVHDLANPHLVDQDAHARALDVLVPAAAEVLTLTAGAAAEVRRRWGVDPTVVPHPQVVPDHDVQDHAPGARPRVGVHLGALRANVDPLPWLDELAAACGHLGAGLEVAVNDEVRAGDTRRRALLDEVGRVLDGHPDARLDVGPRKDDPALHAWVRSLDVCALPYRHGTHSGWLEMCWDLGTAVLVPEVGHYAEQHVEPGFAAPLVPGRVEPALRGLLDARRDGCPWGDVATRLHQRARLGEQVRRAHRDTYARAVGPTTEERA